MAGIEGFVEPKLIIDEETRTDGYVHLWVEPLEAGYGHTLGNALRRVLLSSMKGVAATAVRIEGASHEFCSIPNVVEDVMEIILNVKKLKFNCVGQLPRTLELSVNKEGAVTAADITEDSAVEVLNKEQLICTLDSVGEFRMELDIDRGIGYRPSEENKKEDQPLGTIPVDSLFSPVERVRYDVQNCRVGQRTDYDKLEMEIWTDRRILPLDALNSAATILRYHFTVFIQDNSGKGNDMDIVLPDLNEDEQKLLKLLVKDVSELHLPVRAANCLDAANISYLGELVEKTEAEMLNYRNFGKKSLDEIKVILQESGLDLNMALPEKVKTAMDSIFAAKKQKKED